MLTLDHAYMLH